MKLICPKCGAPTLREKVLGGNFACFSANCKFSSIYYFTPEKLEKLKLELVDHHSLPLRIINYTNESPKDVDLVHFCRGVVINKDTYKVAARPFVRFFNYGENLDFTERFCWNNFKCYGKEDGTLILLYYYDGQWRVNTRRTFGNVVLNEVLEWTWREYFLRSIREKSFNDLDQKFTYLFELCGQYNQLVTLYNSVRSYLLGAIETETGYELGDVVLDEVAVSLGVQRPVVYDFASKDEILLSLQGRSSQFEGYVLKDVTGLRLKIKNQSWLNMFHLKGNNGDRFAKKENMVKIILNNPQDVDEILAYFPAYADIYQNTKAKLDKDLEELRSQYYFHLKTTQSQKEFANAVNAHTKYPSVAFLAKKSGRTIDEVWKQSYTYISKTL